MALSFAEARGNTATSATACSNSIPERPCPCLRRGGGGRDPHTEQKKIGIIVLSTRTALLRKNLGSSTESAVSPALPVATPCAQTGGGRYWGQGEQPRSCA
eukprot:3483161-Pyramimonas_sp.AAC.1